MMLFQENFIRRVQSEGKNALVLLVLISFFLIVLFYWGNTWDDSAITLAFSRNLVRYGDIVPSQFSDRVEGYSTFLWMLINAAFFYFGLGEEMVLAIAKVISTSLTFANLLLFWKMVQEKITSSFYQIVIFILYTINLQTVTSAVFGMETALYAFLVLVSYLLFRIRNRSTIAYISFSLAASLLILIRHEGFLFLIPFVIETIRTNPKNFLREPYLCFWGGTFFTYHIWHFSYFGEYLTNPMIGKGQFPYRPEFAAFMDVVSYYLYPFFRFVAIYPFLILILGIFFIRSRSKKKNYSTKKDADFYLIYGIALTGLFIMLITGRSWNADADRLSYPALAFLFLALFHLIDGTPLFELFSDTKGLLLAVLLAGMLLNIAATHRSFVVSRQFTYTVQELRKDARIVTLTQAFLNMEPITFAGPDMGGLLLFEGDGKRVIDLGLLCNKQLAKHGHGIVDEYVLIQEKPEIIEIHDNWIDPFANSGLLRENYVPVRVYTKDDEILFFVRQEIVRNLDEQQMVEEVKLAEKPDIPADLSGLLNAYGHYFLLDLSN